jgi:uncharacterized protein YndB with AHSA1/START domain
LHVRGRRFAYRWMLQDSDAEEPSEGNFTLVEFTLAPDGDGTRLRVVESGFATLDRSEDVRRERFDWNTEGWKGELGELAEYAQKVAA